MRPWSHVPISDCIEPLVELPLEFLRIEPHPYFSLGAPYGEDGDPWFLRNNIIKRLFNAQSYLQKKQPTLKLAIFDAWRPIAVQAFMLKHSIKNECIARGINPAVSNENLELQKVVDDVGKFWAPPSLNPLTPPPHSTGAAVDLTLCDSNGALLDMGGDIDEIGPRSHPEYFSEIAKIDNNSIQSVFHKRRRLLLSSMKYSGFEQHPNEWWHFSFGDQMWAWKTNSSIALYGATSVVSSSKTL